MIPFPTSPAIRALIAAELSDDLGAGDVSTQFFPRWREREVTATLLARQAGVTAGLPAWRLVWECLGGAVRSEILALDGIGVEPGQTLARFTGPAATLLAGERTGLNLVGHCSGIATLTRAYVDAVEGTDTKICDTRKTLPGLRVLQKYAVRCGRGHNHRMGLDQAVMLKDNHLALLDGGLAEGLRILRAAVGPATIIEVEVTSLADFELAQEHGADVIMLDNMEHAEMAACIAARRPPVRIEASGGITLQRVRGIAGLGVDFISVGRITHSAPALDLALEFTSP